HAYSIAPLRSRLFPYPTLFRSGLVRRSGLRPARLTNPDKSGQTICYRTGQIYLLPTRKYRLYRAPEVGSGNGGGHSEIRRTRSVRLFKLSRQIIDLLDRAVLRSGMRNAILVRSESAVFRCAHLPGDSSFVFPGRGWPWRFFTSSSCFPHTPTASSMAGVEERGLASTSSNRSNRPLRR